MMKKFTYLIIILSSLLWLNPMYSQNIIISGPTELALECPFVQCYKFDFGISCNLPWGGLIGAEATLTPSGGDVEASSTTFIPPAINWQNLSRDWCIKFEQPGTYELCITVSSYCWLTMKEPKLETKCITINVVAGPGDIINQLPYGGGFCDGDRFEWCPGDWGIDEWIDLPESLSCGNANILDPETGCIKFWVCHSGSEWEPTEHTFTVLGEVCGEQQEVDITLFTNDCNPDDRWFKNEEDEMRESLSMRSRNGNVKTSFFPNPAKTELQFETDSEDNLINVYNMNGAIVERLFLSGNSSLDVSSYSNGFYIFEVNNKDGVKYHKIVIQH